MAFFIFEQTYGPNIIEVDTLTCSKAESTFILFLIRFKTAAISFKIPILVIYS